MIEQLEYHNTNELEEWIDLDEKSNEKFLKELVLYADQNQNQIREYCKSKVPHEFSSLSIVYEAFSEHSSNWNEFLFDEIQRVVQFSKTGEIEVSDLEILCEINLDDMAEKDIATYERIMDYLISQLQLKNKKDFTIGLLDIFDWHLIEIEGSTRLMSLDNWINVIKKLANEGDLAVKLKAREVLEENEIEANLKPLSFTEKVFGIFK